MEGESAEKVRGEEKSFILRGRMFRNLTKAA